MVVGRKLDVMILEVFSNFYACDSVLFKHDFFVKAICSVKDANFQPTCRYGAILLQRAHNAWSSYLLKQSSSNKNPKFKLQLLNLELGGISCSLDF